ncbi:MAG TPA: hypothetical protein VNX28_12685, partial [Gemmataceae bacterium]|nr:hypothetical protein [Gemmataceae bacterium]
PGTGYRAIAFHPDGKRLATLGSDQRVHLWDVESARIGQTLEGEIDPCTYLAFSPDGRLLAGGGSAARPSTQLKVWDLAAGRVLHDLSGPSANVSGVAFSSDSRQLLSVGSDARLWDLGDGRLIRVLAGHKGAVLGCAFGPDGTTAATAGADRTVRLWDVRDGAEKIVFRGHRGRVSCMCFSPDGRALASADQQPGEVKVWDPTRSPEFLRLGSPEHRTPEAVAFTADGGHVLSATPDGILKVFDLTTLQAEKHAIDLTAKWHAPAALAAFDGYGRRLAAVTAADLCRVRVWDLQAPGGKMAERAELVGHTLGVYQVAVSRDGRRVATAGLGENGGRRLREVRVWDADTGKTLLALTTPAAQPRGLYGGLALGPGGDYVALDAAADDGRPPRVKVLDVATGRELVDLAGPGAPIGNLAFSADGRLLAAADISGRILVWDWAAHRPLHAEPLQGPWFRLAFSPDGKCLAGADRDQVKLWDMASGQEVLLLRGAPPRSMDGGFNPQLAWSADGRRLAAVNWDATITVWDAGSQMR